MHHTTPWYASIVRSMEKMPFLYAFLAFVLALILLDAVANYKIVKKTGNSGAFSLLFYVPFLNILLWMALAFGEWPKGDRSR